MEHRLCWPAQQVALQDLESIIATQSVGTLWGAETTLAFLKITDKG